MRIYVHRWDRGLLVLLLVLMVWSGIAPADRTVWMVESVWSVGLLAVLSVTRRRFKFSNAAYLCFWFWVVLQTIGAEWLSRSGNPEAPRVQNTLFDMVDYAVDMKRTDAMSVSTVSHGFANEKGA